LSPRKAAPVIGRTASKVLAIPFEDNNMSALVLSIAVFGPVIVRAEDANHQEKRYYDRGGKDYHFME
jgi:hypothetical protein